MVIGPTLVTAPRNAIVTFTYPYTIRPLMLLVSRPDVTTNLFAVVQPFQKLVSKSLAL